MTQDTRSPIITDEQRIEICARIADGDTVRQIAADDWMPSARTIYKALANDDAFAQQYARAREAQLARWEDDILEIADDGSPEDTQRAKLRVDARKWLMAKRAPKKYGDRVTSEISGPEGKPIEVNTTTDLDRAKALAALVARTRAQASGE